MRETLNTLYFVIGAGTLLLFMMWTVSWISRGSNLAYIGLSIFAGICAVGYFVIPSPLTTYHHILVVRKINRLNWWMVKADGPFLYNACPDFDNEKFIWAGYWIKDLKYFETGTCKSIREDRLGVWWERDPVTGDAHAATPEEMLEAESKISAYNVVDRTQERGVQYARSKRPTR